MMEADVVKAILTYLLKYYMLNRIGLHRSCFKLRKILLEKKTNVVIMKNGLKNGGYI